MHRPIGPKSVCALELLLTLCRRQCCKFSTVDTPSLLCRQEVLESPGAPGRDSRDSRDTGSVTVDRQPSIMTTALVRFTSNLADNGHILLHSLHDPVQKGKS